MGESPSSLLKYFFRNFDQKICKNSSYTPFSNLDFDKLINTNTQVIKNSQERLKFFFLKFQNKFRIRGLSLSAKYFSRRPLGKHETPDSVARHPSRWNWNFLSILTRWHNFWNPSLFIQPTNCRWCCCRRLFLSSWAENTSKFRSNVIQSDADLRKPQPSERSCYFEDERKLRFFKVYTRQNCKIRYFSNFSREACNCVSFDLVRDPDTRVCGITVDDRWWSLPL